MCKRVVDSPTEQDLVVPALGAVETGSGQVSVAADVNGDQRLGGTDQASRSRRESGEMHRDTKFSK